MTAVRITFSFFFWSAATLSQAQPYMISTYAGGAPPPTPAPALHMWFGFPQGLATDAAGNVYFSSLHCVFKLDGNRVITRIAGTSRPDFSGDGGPATNAQLKNPGGLAVDAAGNVFMAGGDYSASIRKVSPDGIITTVAGDGGLATDAQLSDPSSLAVDPTGNIYIADTGNDIVRILRPVGSPF